MKLLNKLFNFTLFIQFGLFFVFILLHINELDELEYVIDLGSPIGEPITFTLNLYTILLSLTGLFGVALIASINVVETGLNDYGSSLVGKYIFHFSLMSILTIGNAYYLLSIGFVGGIIQFMFLILWFLKLTSLMETDDSE